jgi:WD40 repeat protein
VNWIARAFVGPLLVASVIAGPYQLTARAIRIAETEDPPPKGAIPPTVTPIRLVNSRGEPVSGAEVAGFFWRDNDREAQFAAGDSGSVAVADSRGQASLKIDFPEHTNATSLYAIRQGKGRPLVGTRSVTREEAGTPVTVVLHPACRVLFEVDSRGLAALEKELNAELTGPGWWRAAYLYLGEGVRGPRPLFTSSTTGGLEFLLPPGRFTIFAYSTDTGSANHVIEIKPGDKEQLVGTIDLPVSESAKRNLLSGHRVVWSSLNEEDRSFRRIRVRNRLLHGDFRDIRDAVFSPDGRTVATAHFSLTRGAFVRLFDWETGKERTTFDIPGRRVVRLRFRTDGKALVAAGDVFAGVAPGVMVWDLASQKGVRTTGGQTEKISAITLSPDAKSVATLAPDATMRLWEVATGRALGSNRDGPLEPSALAFSPDGQRIATATTSTIRVWNVASGRTAPQFPGQGEVSSVTAMSYSPDGRSLAVAVNVPDADTGSNVGQVRLYDLTGEAIRQRAVLTFRERGPELGNQPEGFSDVRFSPNGRHVIVVGDRRVTTWDFATGVEQDSYARGGIVGPGDRMVLSPDGQWLGIIGPFNLNFSNVLPDR